MKKIILLFLSNVFISCYSLETYTKYEHSLVGENVSKPLFFSIRCIYNIICNKRNFLIDCFPCGIGYSFFYNPNRMNNKNHFYFYGLELTLSFRYKVNKIDFNEFVKDLCEFFLNFDEEGKNFRERNLELAEENFNKNELIRVLEKFYYTKCNINNRKENYAKCRYANLSEAISRSRFYCKENNTFHRNMEYIDKVFEDIDQNLYRVNNFFNKDSLFEKNYISVDRFLCLRLKFFYLNYRIKKSKQKSAFYNRISFDILFYIPINIFIYNVTGKKFHKYKGLYDFLETTYKETFYFFEDSYRFSLCGFAFFVLSFIINTMLIRLVFYDIVWVNFGWEGISFGFIFNSLNKTL